MWLHMGEGCCSQLPHTLAMGLSSQHDTQHHQYQKQEQFLDYCGANSPDRCVSYDGFGFAGDDAPSATLGATITTKESNMTKTSSVSEFSLGGDLFCSPQGIMEEAAATKLDSVRATSVSDISGGEDDITILEAINASGKPVPDHESMQDEVFYDCWNDVSLESAIEELFPELADMEFPPLQLEDAEGKADGMTMTMMMMQKCVSYGCLAAEEWMGGFPVKPSFLDFQEVDFGADFGMRRAYSEGDIKTLGNGETSLLATGVLCPPLERTLAVGSYRIEERREKLSRYRKKKSQRNFGRKIKYACRKALADNQPRVRGRFARTEDCQGEKPSK